MVVTGVSLPPYRAGNLMQEAKLPRLNFWGRVVQEPVISRLRAVSGVTIESSTVEALVAAVRGQLRCYAGDTSSYTPAVAAAIRERGGSLRGCNS